VEDGVKRRHWRIIPQHVELLVSMGENRELNITKACIISDENSRWILSGPYASVSLNIVDREMVRIKVEDFNDESISFNYGFRESAGFRSICNPAHSKFDHWSCPLLCSKKGVNCL
jgi:hypothetical protein